MRTSIFAALAVSAMLLASCATSKSLPDRLDEFVEKTEKEYKNYTEDDWKKSREEYETLVAEMEENYDSYTTAEKTRTFKAMGKYSSMVLENEVGKASETIGGILESIPEKINDIINNIDTTAIRESVDSVKSSISGIIESIDTERLRKAVEGLTESIDTAKLREKLDALVKIFGGE